MKHPNEATMQEAINSARESFPENGNAVAAIIVKGDKIIAKAFTTVKTEKDSTCHAEMNAIRQASKNLDSQYLEDCYLYTTFEPCPMCTTAAIWSKMKGIVYGASRKDATPQEHWRIMIASADLIAKGDPKLELYEEFMRDECKSLLEIKSA